MLKLDEKGEEEGEKKECNTSSDYSAKRCARKSVGYVQNLCFYLSLINATRELKLMYSGKKLSQNITLLKTT
jgi:hypothetical protein